MKPRWSSGSVDIPQSDDTVFEFRLGDSFFCILFYVKLLTAPSVVRQINYYFQALSNKAYSGIVFFLYIV